MDDLSATSRTNDPHEPVGVAVTPSIRAVSSRQAQRTGRPLPGLEVREVAAGAAPQQGRPADSWYGSHGTQSSRVLSMQALATAAESGTDTSTATGTGPPAEQGPAPEAAPAKPAKAARKSVKGPVTEVTQDDRTDVSSRQDIGDQAAGWKAPAGLIAEIIVGSDDRQEITDTKSPPYPWICDLDITDRTGMEWKGTGWLAAPGLIITAGHCVYLANSGGWARTIEVYPGRQGGDAPYSVTAVEMHSVGGWVNDGKPECDYGAIILPAQARSQLGYLGFAAFSDDELAGELVNIVGYPADKPDGTMWGSVRTLEQSLPDLLFYENDTYGGMSGSPVIRWDGSDYLSAGIHNYGDVRGNRATRITEPVFRNIQNWAARAASLQQG